jgi:predicted GH43/DUF377 family glycosyl hydrolase
MTLFLIVAAAVLCSCSRTPTLEERLQSADPSVVRAAISEMWRVKGYENIAPAVSLLGKPEYMEETANALCMLNDPAVDNLVLSGLGSGADNEGRLYFAFLTARERYIKGDIADFIKQNMKKFTPAAKFYSYMILSFQDKRNINTAISLFKSAAMDKSKYALVDLLRLIGDTGYTPAYDFTARAGKTYPGAGAIAAWAQHRIRARKLIKYDAKDGVITLNPYLKKEADNPVWPSVPNSFKAWHTANPDILATESTVYFYYRSGDGTDRISLATVPYNIFNGKNFIDVPNNPILDVSKKTFDSRAVLDPAALYFNKKVFMYYSGLGEGDDSIGLAISGDYMNFVKEESPVMTGRAPGVVFKDGVIYMYYVLRDGIGGYEIHLATSTDGYKFTPFGRTPVFTRGPKGSWDDKSVTTPRISVKDGVYYMIYAGGGKYLDYPPCFGMAFSYDLVHWTRSTQNPVFSRGKKGQWDDGAIWFGDMFLYKGKYNLYYEGWGGNDSHDQEYGRGGHSQVGLATGVFNIEEML